jgi:hypothetical protein
MCFLLYHRLTRTLQLPLWMRVGYWSPFVVVSLAFFYTALIKYKPSLEFQPSAIAKYGEETPYLMWMPKETMLDLAIFLWGVVVIIHAKVTLHSIAAFPISFTGWSWILLTLRAFFEFGSWLSISLGMKSLSTTLAVMGSSIRLAVITNACVVFTIWNFLLLPIITFVSMPRGERRQRFLKFNFGFFMTNIHLLNFPLAVVNILCGNRIREFSSSDLWVSYAVVMCYSIVYFGIMDRLGLHFYPIFCPRSNFCVLSIVGVLGLYYWLFLKWNELIATRVN